MLTATLNQLEQFGVGDVVTPKTGGPRMTVTHVNSGDVDGDWLLCQWFDEFGEFRQDRFTRDAVVREPRSISPGRVHLRRYAGFAGSQA